MAYNYEDKLIETIKYIADSAVAAAPYDKTVKATILSCDDESIAKYKVRYQDAIFFAYGSTNEVHFSPGTEVYVLIPNNDLTRDKTILGSTEKLGTNYVSIMNNDIIYVPTGNNAVETTQGYNLSSFRTEEKIIYDIGSDFENELKINNNVLKKSLVDTTFIRLGAKFTTEIPQKQQGGTGNYGIKFILKFLKNDGSLDRGKQDINCVSREYIININDIENDPYNLNEQLQEKYFEIDGKNFIEIEKILIFSEGFTYQDASEPNDIYIDNFNITSVKRKDEISANGAWMIVTAPAGPYFDETHIDDSKKRLETTIYVGGKKVNSESQKVDYYWFVEDVRVNSNWEDEDFYKQNYCSYGGQGWRCLNDYNIIKNEEENKEIIEWIGSKSYLDITKREVVSQELRYKCIAVYNDLILKDEVIFHNYDSNYKVSIESSAGTLFYFDSGTTNLTCRVENYSGNNINYVWGMVDYLGNEYYFKEKTIQNGIINGNEIINLPVYEIIKFSTYRCSAYEGDNLLGIGSIILTNSMEQGGQYNLIIKNGSQIFKYNENGVAPNENPDGTPFMLKPLEFILYDSQGKEIDHEFLNNDYKWILPIDKSLLVFNETYTEEDIIVDEDGNRWVKWKGHETLSYNIVKQYNYNYTNNIIKLEVNYQGATFIAETNFTFTKEGENGTNGTDYFCRVIPNYTDTNLIYPLLAVHEKQDDKITFYCNGKSYPEYLLGNFLKAEIWENGEQILSGYSVQWEILKNKYKNSGTNQIIDKSYLQYNQTSGQWERVFNNNNFWYIIGTNMSKAGSSIPWSLNPPTIDTNAPALIIRAIITYNGSKYYATYPLNWLTLNPANTFENYTFNIKGGFRYVTYAADGTRPQYLTEPFKIIVKNEDIDITKNCVYSWSIYGYLYNNNIWVKKPENGDSKFRINDYLEEGSTEPVAGMKKIIPPDSYDGHCVNYIIQCEIRTNSNTVIAVLQMPIHMMLNRYGHAALNDWDGNSISIGADGNGVILAPQVGAGQKNTDPTSEYYNSFTGVLMRKSKRSKSYPLLYWYSCL